MLLPVVTATAITGDFLHASDVAGAKGGAGATFADAEATVATDAATHTELWVYRLTSTPAAPWVVRALRVRCYRRGGRRGGYRENSNSLTFVTLEY